MKYFAYGSNMSLKRLQQRVLEVIQLGIYSLASHELRFHKSGKDNSGKCDAYYTGVPHNRVIGILYEIDLSGKASLDVIEGLGHGYNDKTVSVSNRAGEFEDAVTYYSTDNDESLLPYSWYKEHVLVGARAARLPSEYIAMIESVETISDKNLEREAAQRAIYNPTTP